MKGFFTASLIVGWIFFIIRAVPSTEAEKEPSDSMDDPEIIEEGKVIGEVNSRGPGDYD